MTTEWITFQLICHMSNKIIGKIEYTNLRVAQVMALEGC